MPLTTAQYLSEMQLNTLVKLASYVFFVVILLLTIATLFHYTGRLYVYILFSVVANALLYFGFRKNAIFFDTFIGIFFWLGFWLKLTVRVLFANGVFNEAVGSFDGSGAAFDRALLVAACGMMGLLLASYVREKFIFRYPEKSVSYTQSGLFNFYKEYRSYVLSGFVILFLTIALSNAYLGMYQRGGITETVLPFGLNGVYKWLLLFGLASVSAVILRCELLLKNAVTYPVVILSLLESFSTNVSLLSRGMILNVSALAYGWYKTLKIHSIRLNFRVLAASVLIFTVLFVSSVYAVNYLRSPDSKKSGQGLEQGQNKSMRIAEAQNMAKPLLLDRWVGMEGVMAVSSSPRLGWNLWREAWDEKYSENVMSFYDRNLITSPYLDDDFSVTHFVSLPGILAFCFYPGSFAFLLGCMFLMGLLAATIEISAFKLGGSNLILCALIAEVVAYRFVSFGYVPAQSYLLFGTILLNLLIIYWADKFIGAWHDKKLNGYVIEK